MGKRSAKGVFVRHDVSLFLLVSGVVFFFFVDYHRLLPFPYDLHYGEEALLKKETES
jgi:hypothetical protein